MTIRIGTRGSKLALWQAEWVSQQLATRGYEVDIRIISTTGDVSTASLSQVGGQGVFTKEIQTELHAGNVDVAVHSLKDLPTEQADGLTIAAVPPRETTRDCLISHDNKSLLDLPSGSKIGTGSLRRGSQILAWRSDVVIADIRGNVDSRLRKLEEGQYDAIILAAAGLTRLKLTEHIAEFLPQEQILPAIGQGALGLECRSDDEETRAALAKLNDPASFWEVTAERSFLASLLAGCLAPVAALAKIEAEKLVLRGRVISRDGSKVIEGTESGAVDDASAIGDRLADQLRLEGAAELIEDARRAAE